MTPDDLAAIRKRLRYATSGPYYTARHNDWTGKVAVESETDYIADCADMTGNDDQDAANADFIAHARTDIPALLAHIDGEAARTAAAVREALILAGEIVSGIDALIENRRAK